VRVKRVLESCLYVSDLALSLEFYRQVLGLELHTQQEGRHLFFRCGDGMVLLFNPETTQLPSGTVPAHGAFGPGHLAFAVDRDDLPAWKERLENLGVPIEAEVAWPGGGQSLYLRDPSGNSIELASPQIWQLPDTA
jgi:catechol 2,3-dioxygenase-like lactoylglutathione lyase family enzyme